MATKRVKNVEFELAKFIAKRELYFSEIEDLHRLSQNIENHEGAMTFLTRFSGFDEIREKFLKMVEVVNDLHFQLNPEFKPEYEMLRKAERLRCSILEAANILKKEKEIDVSSAPSNSFKLPKITLPEFNGDITEWPLFFEKFNSIIHRNPGLNDLAKLHYLLGSLRGKALDVCVGFTPTASNYPVLLETLKSRYDNKRLLADHYVTQILETKPLPQESASGLSQVLVRVDTAWQSLQNLRLPNLSDYFMANFLLSKLDPQTRRAFEMSTHEPIPSYGEIRQFVHKQIDALSQLPKTRTTQNKNPNPSTHPQSSPSGWKTFVNQTTNHNNNTYNNPTNKLNNNETNQWIKCPICGNTHQVFRCDSFIKLTPNDRVKLAQNGNLCMNCLRPSHSTQLCNSRFRCRFCNENHHTLLHLGKSVESPAASPQPPSSSDERPSCSFFTKFESKLLENLPSENIPILPTAVIRIETPYGDREARFLIDSGSQRHFISQACCRDFHLSFRPECVPLEGMGNVPLQAIGTTEFKFKSLYDSSEKFQISALVTERVTRCLPSDTVSVKHLTYLQNLPLADREFFIPGRIDGILGAQLFGKIVTGAAVMGPDQTTHAIPTILGHIVMGDAPKVTPDRRPDASVISSFCILDNQELNRAVQRFWELEEVPMNPKLTEEERNCEVRFQTSTTRIDGKRYSVELPFKEFPPLLGDSFQSAERRFYSLERRFKKDPNFASQYASVIQDYLSQGHLSPVSASATSDENAYFIPHFAVVKESSSTPLRIVFDASAKTSNGRSLNDVLFTGPKLQKDITQILTSFRTSAIALIADIRQMYRNIQVHQQHRRFQQILWRDTPQDPLQIFQLNCVVFGVSSAPYLALRTVQQLAADEAENFPLASQLTQQHMYVDDLVVSLESVPTALEAYQQLVRFFRAGGFKLTKWATNSRQLLEKLPPEDRLSRPVDFADSSQIHDVIKVLGLTWDSVTDTFTFNIKTVTPKFTKRGVLSVVARIWDPLGFLAPVTLYAKALMKELWNAGLSWDDPLPPAFQTRWQRFISELPNLQDLRIPRHFGTDSGSSVTLIGFADSSETGYGAVVYLRLVKDTPIIHLLCAKSRVAPQKTVTIPKLELCAAVLLSRLMGMCLATLNPHFQSISKIALTDSTVTLAWIKNDSKKEVFVANRLSLIGQTLNPDEWFHVRSEDNIADIISRGMSPAQMVSHKSWLHGPPWLSLDPDAWPIHATVSSPKSEDLQVPTSPLEKIVTLLNTTSKNDDGFEDFLRRFSSLKKLLRVTVCLLRFGKRLPLQSTWDPAAMETAERIIVRQVQRQHFPEEFALLEKNMQCSSRIRSLSPFVDGELLRVGGRLSHADLPFDAKHPILLPKNSHLSHLLISDCHSSNFHTGPNLVFSLLRQKYWILSARSAVRKLIKSCNFCFKRSPRPTFPPMADLPAPRVLEAKSFVHTGVDYAGPFQVTISRRRGIKTQKAYLCLFICLATKAVHLELASSLSTEAFLACFKRFVARRGPVQVLYSDRGTNFVGAKAELDAIYTFLQQEDFRNPFQNFLGDHRIQWKFNPPSAPHFGGIWEANIKSVKAHLVKAIGNQILTYEELYTILTQIESILNSRPLHSDSSDPRDPLVLTPAHFLNLTPLRTLPLSDQMPTRSLTERKRLIDAIVRSFWERWKRDYLNSLQTRQKWRSPVKPLEVGSVVVVKSDSTPPLQWPLAVVEEVHPGPDGVTRVVTVRTSKGIFQRPVAKLCPLPTQ